MFRVISDGSIGGGTKRQNWSEGFGQETEKGSERFGRLDQGRSLVTGDREVSGGCVRERESGT